MPAELPSKGKSGATRRGHSLCQGWLREGQSVPKAESLLGHGSRKGSQTSSITITSELVRNANCWVPLHSYCIRNSWGWASSLFLQALQVTQVRELLLWEKPSPQSEHIKSKGGFLLTRWKTMSLIWNSAHFAHRKWKPLKIQGLYSKVKCNSHRAMTELCIPTDSKEQALEESYEREGCRQRWHSSAGSGMVCRRAQPLLEQKLLNHSFQFTVFWPAVFFWVLHWEQC